jgi:hypothetical protein
VFKVIEPVALAIVLMTLLWAMQRDQIILRQVPTAQSKQHVTFTP